VIYLKRYDLKTYVNNKRIISGNNNKLKSLLKSETVTRSDALVNCADAHLCSAKNELQSSA